MLPCTFSSVPLTAYLLMAFSAVDLGSWVKTFCNNYSHRGRQILKNANIFISAADDGVSTHQLCPPYEAYDVQTNYCYPVNSIGPCGSLAIFVSLADNPAYGECVCQPYASGACNRPLSYWPDYRLCFELYTQVKRGYSIDILKIRLSFRLWFANSFQRALATKENGLCLWGM